MEKCCICNLGIRNLQVKIIRQVGLGFTGARDLPIEDILYGFAIHLLVESGLHGYNAQPHYIFK